MATARSRRETADSECIPGRIGEGVLVTVLDPDRLVHGSNTLMTELAEQGPVRAAVRFVLVIHVVQNGGKRIGPTPLALIPERGKMKR